MCVSLRVCMYTHVSACVCAHLYLSVQHVCHCAYVHARVCMSVSVCMHVCARLYLGVQARVSLCICAHTRLHECVRVRTWACWGRWAGLLMAGTRPAVEAPT